MIKVRYGELGLGQSVMFAALDTLFSIPFKKFKTIDEITELQEKVTKHRNKFAELQRKIGEAHGTKDDNGIVSIPLNNPEIIKLIDKEIELDVKKISILKSDVEETGAGISAKERIALEPFVDFK